MSGGVVRAAAFPFAMLAGVVVMAGTLLLMGVFLPACGVTLPFFGSIQSCPAPAAVAAPSLPVEALTRRVAELQAQIDQQCLVAAAQPVAPGAGGENAGLSDGTGLNDAPDDKDEMAAIESLPDQVEERPDQAPKCDVRIEEATTVVVLDGSSSMLVPLDVDRQLEERLARMSRLGVPFATDRLNALQRLPGTKRMEVAKGAVVDLLEQLPPDRRSVFGFTDCNAIRNMSGAEAISQVERFQANRATPLAATVSMAASSVSPEQPATMVVVTDGDDTCGGDVCAVARSIAQSHPKLAINVVDLSGWTEVSCLSTVTGGRYVPFDQGMNVAELIEKQALETKICE